MSKKILFWLGVSIVSLLVMVQPARAESISATSTEQSATWAGSVCSFSTISAADACYKQLSTCGGLPVSPPSTLSYSFVSWSVNATQQCKYVQYNGVLGGFGNVNTTCSAGTFNAATNKCYVYSCPSNQNWTLSGGTCTRPDCVAPQERQVNTGVCVDPAEVCPNDNLKGYLLTGSSNIPSPLPPSGYVLGCARLPGASSGCVAMAFPLASIFGISLLSQTTTSEVCSPSTGFTFIEPPTIVSLVDPEVIKFQEVIDKAQPLSIEITTSAIAASTAAAQVVEQRISVIGSGVTDAYAKALAKENAAKEVQKAGQEFIANPTPQTLDIYNQKMNDYNGKSVASDTALAKAKSDWQILEAVRNSAQAQADAGAAVRLAIQQLQTAIAASGQPFNTGDINAKIGDLAGLEAANASALGKLAEAIAKLQAVQGDVTNITNTNTTNSTTVNGTAAAVEAVASGSGSGVPASGVGAASAVPPAETPIDCQADPTNAACTTECQKHPELAVCAELGTVPDDVPLVEKEINISAIQPVQVGNAGACPAPLPMVLHGQTYFMKFDTYCNFATGIKPIILAFAWLAGAGILIGGFRAA